jgi:hypothetical protein
MDNESGFETKDLSKNPSSFFANDSSSTSISGVFSKPAQAPKYAVIKSSVDETIDQETGSSYNVTSQLFGNDGESKASAAVAVLASIEAASVVAPVEVDLTSTFFGGNRIVNHEIERLGLPLRVLQESETIEKTSRNQVTLVSTSDLFAEEDEECIDYDNGVIYDDVAYFSSSSSSSSNNEMSGYDTIKNDTITSLLSKDISEPFNDDFGLNEGRRRVNSVGILNQSLNHIDHGDMILSQQGISRAQTYRPNIKVSKRLPTPGGAMDFFKTLPRTGNSQNVGWDIFSSLPIDVSTEEGQASEEERNEPTFGDFGIQQYENEFIRDINTDTRVINEELSNVNQLLDPAPIRPRINSNSFGDSNSNLHANIHPPPWEISSSNSKPFSNTISEISSSSALISESTILSSIQTHSSLPPWEIGVKASTKTSFSITSTSNLISKIDSIQRPGPIRAPWEEISTKDTDQELSSKSSLDISNAGFIPQLASTKTKSSIIGSQTAFVPAASAFDFTPLPPVNFNSSTVSPPHQFSSTSTSNSSLTSAPPEVEGHLSSGVPPRTAMQHPGLKKKSSTTAVNVSTRYFNPSASAPLPNLSNVTEEVLSKNVDKSLSTPYSSSTSSSSSHFPTVQQTSNLKIYNPRTCGATFGFGGRLVSFSSHGKSPHIQIQSVGKILKSTQVPFLSSLIEFPGPLTSSLQTQRNDQNTSSKSSNVVKDSVLRFLNRPDSIFLCNYENDEEPGMLGGFKGFRKRDLTLLNTVLRLLIFHEGSFYQPSTPQSLLPGVANSIATALLDGIESIDDALKIEEDAWRSNEEVDMVNTIDVKTLTNPIYTEEENKNINSTELKTRQLEIDKALISGDRLAAFEAAFSSKFWGQSILLGIGLGGTALSRVATAFSETLPIQSISRWIYPALSGDLSFFVKPPLTIQTLKMAYSSSSISSSSNPNISALTAITDIQERLLFCRSWRTRLALLLLNGVSSASEPRTLISLGDRIWTETGSSACAHALYIIAGATIEPPSPHARVVLVGADHRRRLSTFLSDAMSIQRSEVLEYALLLRKGGSKDVKLANVYKSTSPVMQPLKLVYAMTLVDSDSTLARCALEYIQSIDAALKEVDEEKRFNPMFLAELSSFSTRLQVYLGSIPIPVPEEFITSREIQDAEDTEAAVIATQNTASGAATILTVNAAKSNTESINNQKSQQNVDKSSTVDENKTIEDKTRVDGTNKVEASSKSVSSVVGGGILSSLTDIIFRRTESAVSSTVGGGTKVLKHAHLAKTNAPQPYFDETLKRWVFPGEETTSAPVQSAPPTSNNSSTKTNTASSLSSVTNVNTSTVSLVESNEKKSKSESIISNITSITTSESRDNPGPGVSVGGGVGSSRRTGRSRYVDTLGGSSTVVTAAPVSVSLPLTLGNTVNANKSGPASKISVFAPPPPPAPTQQEIEEAEAERQRLLEAELEALRKSQIKSQVSTSLPDKLKDDSTLTSPPEPIKVESVTFGDGIVRSNKVLPELDF